MGAVPACPAVCAERIVLAAFLVAAVLVASQAVFRAAADCLEVGASSGDSLADSRVLVDYWAGAVTVSSPVVGYFGAVSKHLDSGSQAYLARPLGAAGR